MLDFTARVWYIITMEEPQTNRKGDKKMELFEIMDTYMTEVREWADFEADLAEGNPWD